MDIENIPLKIKGIVDESLDIGEKIDFISKGRVEFTDTSFFGSLFFWVKYIVFNYLFIFLTAFYKQTAYLVLTEKRLIIVTDEGVNFPLWVVPFSRQNESYLYPLENISSAMGRRSQIFWFMNSKGIEIESSGGRLVNFNGMQKEDFLEGLKLIGKRI